MHISLIVTDLPMPKQVTARDIVLPLYEDAQRRMRKFVPGHADGLESVLSRRSDISETMASLKVDTKLIYYGSAIVSYQRRGHLDRHMKCIVSFKVVKSLWRLER